MKLIEIFVEFNYGAQRLEFSKCFELSFVPFFGMQLSEKINEDEENIVKLNNNDYVSTDIDYNITEDKFYIYIRNNWTRYGVSNEHVDEIVKNFTICNWVREDSTDIDRFKKIMTELSRTSIGTGLKK